MGKKSSGKSEGKSQPKTKYGIECVAHHIDENHILYIPKEIHKQSHNLNDKESITKVNGDFLIWLGKRKNIKVI